MGDRRAVPPYGDPHQPDGLSRFGRKGAVVLDAESEPPVVRDEAGMPLGHRGLDRLEVRADQVRRGQLRLRQLVRRTRERAADLLEIDRQHLRADAELLVELGDEVERVDRRVGAGDRAGDARRVDLPVVQGVDRGVKKVLAHRVGYFVALVGGNGFEESLVGELGERLADQGAVRDGPGFRLEVRRSSVSLPHSSGLRSAYWSRVQKLNQACLSGNVTTRCLRKPMRSFRA